MYTQLIIADVLNVMLKSILLILDLQKITVGRPYRCCSSCCVPSKGPSCGFSKWLLVLGHNVFSGERKIEWRGVSHVTRAATVFW